MGWLRRDRKTRLYGACHNFLYYAQERIVRGTHLGHPCTQTYHQRRGGYGLHGGSYFGFESFSRVLLQGNSVQYIYIYDIRGTDHGWPLLLVWFCVVCFWCVVCCLRVFSVFLSAVFGYVFVCVFVCCVCLCVLCVFVCVCCVGVLCGCGVFVCVMCDCVFLCS